MTNGEAMNERLDFEEHIKGMSDRQLQEFTARTIYTQGTAISELCIEIKTKASKKTVTGVLTVLGAVVIGMVIYVMKHIGFPQ